MSFAALLNKSIVIERSYAGIVAATSTTPEHPLLDDYGQPVLGWATLATVAGRIRPLTATEVVNQSQGGAAITTHVVYLAPTNVTSRDRVRLASQATGPYYQLTGVRDAAGHGHHLECDAREVF